MIFEQFLLPDEMYDTFEGVTPDHLLALGKKYIFCDIDNTLATYDDPKPPEGVIRWCRKMNDSGITISFVSNNNKDRVDLFNHELGYVAYANAKKPMTGILRRAMSDSGASAEESALLGDQLLTDAAAARRAGLYCIIVPPIKDKKNAFFRFKRWLEKPYVRKFKSREV